MKILRLPDVQRRTGLSRSLIYLRMSEGAFPQKINLGLRAVGWVESEIDEWIEAAIVARAAKATKPVTDLDLYA